MRFKKVCISALSFILANCMLFGCTTVEASVIQSEVQNMKVTADIRETFVVTLPKSLALTVDSSGNATGSYTVDVDGSIAGGNVINVAPEDTFALTQVGKPSVTATVTQSNKVFYDPQFTGDIGSDVKFVNNPVADTDATGSISASGVGAGSWSGNLKFNISLASADPMAKFAKTIGKDLFVNNMRYTIKGMIIHNAVAASPTQADPDMASNEDYAEIASLGFNTVRYLFNYNILEEEDQPGILKSTAFDWMDQNIEWAENNGLHIILDYHLTRGGVPTTGGNENIWTVGEDNQEALVKVWDAISKRYKDNPTVLGYGLVNEPYINTNNEADYNNLLDRLVTTIRANDTNHTLFVQRAQKGNPKTYVYPTVNDDNWVMEVHKYPGSEMKIMKDYFDIPTSYLYYGNDDVVSLRADSKSTATNKTTLVLEGATESKGITTDWVEKTFTFTASDSNNAEISYEVMNLTDGQTVEFKDVAVYKGDKEIYNMTYNLSNSFYSSGAGTIDYKAKENLIKLTGAISYKSFKDTGYFRFFKVDPGQEYTVKLKVKSSTGVSGSARVKINAQEYWTKDMYCMNKDYNYKLLSTEDVDSRYNVPVFYGEIGSQRSAYDSGRNVNQLTRDMLEYMVDNRCNFAYFVWHEKYWGVYTGDGLQPKDNPNTELIEDFRELLLN